METPQAGSEGVSMDFGIGFAWILASETKTLDIARALWPVPQKKNGQIAQNL